MKSLLWWCVGVALYGLQARGEQLLWFSDAGQVNINSAGQPMDAGFRFELGVFDPGFVPSQGNRSEWSDRWNPAQRVLFNPGTKLFSGALSVTANVAPFVSGAAAYVWGFKGTPEAGEWILFRHGSWNWPTPDPLNPLPLEWNASTATAVLGQIDADGSPFLMKSAAVAGMLPPSTTWAQWRSENLSGQSRNGPQDDPDGDRMVNLLEFVFGTTPLSPNPPVPLAPTLVGGRLQVTIPRRADHVATLSVEVSSDLVSWQSGPQVTEVVSSTPTAMVVRDLTPAGSGSSRRFLRVRASLP